MKLIAALERLNELADAFVTTSFHIPSLKSPCIGRASCGNYLPKRVSHAPSLCESAGRSKGDTAAAGIDTAVDRRLPE
jgi:hypothetical protein